MIHWIRQVESLTERYDYTLLLECAENYVCEVSKAILLDFNKGPDHSWARLDSFGAFCADF